MTAVPRGLVVFGFGGHARSVADIALTLGIEEIIFVDEAAHVNESLWGFPLRKTFDEQLPDGWQAFAASGDNQTRQVQVAAIAGRSWPLATLVSPTATIGNQSSISAGCFIGHHAHVGPLSIIGEACIINTGAVVDHECKIGDYTHVSVNASVAGRCHLGSFVFLGAGAVVIDKVSIADSITVGAGGVVIKSLVEPGTYVGAPARPVEAKTDRARR
ncbi:acetyltransferase [Bradyrhizobium sp.]|jgi:UDP-N-acetylbacillosamine N-acetyltransferase|uniref:acetyltransferase n=1 Tax=Bradyrhizobium sp. TaxID=376 RepID=UPI002E09EBBE|nr:acetyltransferase [Bradyrhizobium sp.]